MPSGKRGPPSSGILAIRTVPTEHGVKRYCCRTDFGAAGRCPDRLLNPTWISVAPHLFRVGHAIAVSHPRRVDRFLRTVSQRSQGTPGTGRELPFTMGPTNRCSCVMPVVTGLQRFPHSFLAVRIVYRDTAPASLQTLRGCPWLPRKRSSSPVGPFPGEFRPSQLLFSGTLGRRARELPHSRLTRFLA